MHSVLTAEAELHWLALKMVPGLGARRAARLLESFSSPEAVFRATASELEAAGLMSALARSVASGCSFEDAAAQQNQMREAGAVCLPISDPRYPAALREIFDPPVLLFARGRVELLARTGFGVVGTRRPTPYGLAAAERLAADLAAAGLVITSGMARGIDTAAHKGALSVSGDTVAVFGCGVDVVYPSENRKLTGDIATKGLILSEFPMGAAAFPQNFPTRNRVITGMSVGILVVEGAQYSGSSITARLALEQGREVFAVPGNITSRMSWGPNLLIKQGAKLVQGWNDIVTELPAAVRLRILDEGRERVLDQQFTGNLGEEVESEASNASSSGAGPLDELRRRVLRALQVDAPTHLDALIDVFEGSTTSELIAVLFDLEMLGEVRQLPGKNFVKVWGPKIG